MGRDREDREVRRDLINFEGVRYAPENEMGVVFLFAKLHKRLGFPEIEFIGSRFPDCRARVRESGGVRRTWVEFEYRSSQFKEHLRELRRLTPKKGYVVCWEDDWAECERYAQVIELREHVGAGWRVWVQPILPKYHAGLDRLSRRPEWGWTVAGAARPGDLVLMYRAGKKAQARADGADADLLQSITEVCEVRSLPRPNRNWRWEADVRLVARLRNPLRLGQLRADPVLKSAPWVRGSLQGRPEVTAYWWRLYELIVQLNPELRRDKKLQDFRPG